MHAGDQTPTAPQRPLHLNAHAYLSGRMIRPPCPVANRTLTSCPTRSHLVLTPEELVTIVLARSASELHGFADRLGCGRTATQLRLDRNQPRAISAAVRSGARARVVLTSLIKELENRG